MNPAAFPCRSPANGTVASNNLSGAVTTAIRDSKGRRERLVLVAGCESQGKTAALKDIASQTEAPLINVNLELSRRLLQLPSSQRPRRAGPLLREILDETRSDLVLLDRLEILFDANLHQNPLRLLKDLSRQRTIVAAWRGFVDGGHIRYAEAGHPEYRRDPLGDVLVLHAHDV